MTVAVGKNVRAGSAAKRTAILTAARELFLRDGVERTSMDAIAAKAPVSKRTVYDYFGDKQRLLLAVVDDAAESMRRSFEAALDRHLSDDAVIEAAGDLEQALIAFAVEIGTTVIASADHRTVFTLIGDQRADLSEVERRLIASTEPEEAVAERLARYHRAGLIAAPDARLAADHFTALTILLAYNNQPDPSHVDPDHVRATMTAGVQAFMRAYAAQPRTATRSKARPRR